MPPPTAAEADHRTVNSEPDPGALQVAAPAPAPTPAALRAWAHRLVEAREEERLRIARDLHDDLGQRLTTLRLEVAGLAQEVSGPGPAQRLASMNALIDATMEAVHRISEDLRPLVLDDLGLHAAVEALARTAAERMGIEVTVRHGEQDPQVPTAVAMAVYRMVQEALTNVDRHANATDVNIDLCMQGPHLLLVVEDNGVGFPDGALERPGGWGLQALRERAQRFGGRLEVDNAPGSGARLRVWLPANAAEGRA